MKNYLLILVLLMFLSSCQKQNLRNAEDSLVGTWKVTEIFSATGIRTSNGISIDSSATETGDLGVFVFTEDEVDYTFNRQNMSEMGKDSWTLMRTKENAGFNKIEVYTLTFDDFIFDCAFGDQTSDAEKKASDIRLTSETQTIGDYVTFSLTLVKE